jgi:hypothetical protein
MPQGFLNNYTDSRTVREYHLNSLQNTLPVAFRNFFESEEAPKGEFSILCILHPNLSVLSVRRFSRTPQDLSSDSGVLAGDDGIAQLRIDWNKIEGRACAVHGEARDRHGTQEIEATLHTHFVVGLKCRDSLRNDLSLRVNPVGGGLVHSKHQEDEDWVSINQGHICLCNAIGITANGERDGVTREHSDATPIEAQKLQRLDGEVNNETLLASSDGEIEVAEVPDGGLGKGGIGIIGKGVEDGRIDVVE